MRDPNRIYTICFQIAKVWHDNVPDWRFTQLFVNFMSHMQSDCFYMKDEDFIMKLEEFLKEIKEK